MLQYGHVNAEIGTQRGFVCTSVALAEVKRIKNHFDVSINDVVLALTASTMRRYLLVHGGVPQEPARVNMAVSLRNDDDSAASNAITSVNVCLHTDKPDPLERLKAIHGETDVAKRMARASQSSMYDPMNSLPPFALALLNRAIRPEMVLAMMKCNFVVSNVKGSSAPMYLAGARIEAMYPISLLANGIGLNFTCVSYVDHIDFGITHDQELVPNAWQIADGLHDAAREYLRLAGPAKASRKAVKPPRGRRMATRSGGSTRTR